MYGVAGDKATDLDQIGRFVFNFGNPTISIYRFLYEIIAALARASALGSQDHKNY